MISGLEVPLGFEGGYLRLQNLQDVHTGYVSKLNDRNVNRYLMGPNQ